MLGWQTGSSTLVISLFRGAEPHAVRGAIAAIKNTGEYLFVPIHSN